MLKTGNFPIARRPELCAWLCSRQYASVCVWSCQRADVSIQLQSKNNLKELLAWLVILCCVYLQLLHFTMIMQTSMVQTGGWGNRSPLSSTEAISLAGMPSYGLEPNVISSHTVTPAEHRPSTTQTDSLVVKVTSTQVQKDNCYQKVEFSSDE